MKPKGEKFETSLSEGHASVEWRKIMKNANYNWLVDAIKFLAAKDGWGVALVEAEAGGLLSWDR